jgi:hypothetical protein
VKAWQIMPLVIISLLLAVWTGWIRIGWNFPVTKSVGQHGELMIGSFLTTVILLERAVTFKNKLVLLLPFINGLSGVLFAIGYPVIAQYFLLTASIGFCIMVLHFMNRYKEFYYYLFFAGAFCLAMGNWLLIKNEFYPQAVPWWMGYLLLTIVAERLELSKFLKVTAFQQNLLNAALVVAFAGLLIPFHLYGNLVFAAGLIFTALWLFKFDMAIKSVRRAGQHRYSGVVLLAGYAWLIVTAFFLYAGNANAFYYDATLHAFFIGFVISMIFSHAPIILPAVLKLPVKPYRPVLYVWFVLMQASLIVRIISDVAMAPVVRKWSGMVNGITILAFFITIAFIVNYEVNSRKQLVKA